jgi:hypothetical protein
MHSMLAAGCETGTHLVFRAVACVGGVRVHSLLQEFGQSLCNALCGHLASPGTTSLGLAGTCVFCVDITQQKMITAVRPVCSDVAYIWPASWWCCLC